MILDFLFKNRSERYLKQIEPLVQKINDLESDYEKLTQDEIFSKYQEWKDRVKNGENINKFLPEVFAAVREASKRTIEKRHFDVQLMGGIIIANKKIAEMKTGEGKTLMSTLPVVLFALTGKSVHVVTANDYLAKRDCLWMRPIYSFFGLTNGYVVHDSTSEERRLAYKSDITFGPNHEFGFDFLRQNLATNYPEDENGKPENPQRLNFVVIDEIDNLLIDEARTPLIISQSQTDERAELYDLISPVIADLTEGDYEQNIRSKTAVLTRQGFNKVEEELARRAIIKGRLSELQNVEHYHVITKLVTAHFAMFNGYDYVVKNDEIIIVDEFTGRLATGRRFSSGLHSALEAKEKVKVREESVTVASISYPYFFKEYTEGISGMTGTAITEVDEFSKIYDLEVIQVPPNKPCIRIDDQDIPMYRRREEMFLDMAQFILEKHEIGQPVLVCTPSVTDSTDFSKVLESMLGYKPTVLNAVQNEREADLVAEAGRLGAITISTNMAGRGTDILLGGDISWMDPIEKEKEQKAHDEEERKVIAAGGLCVLIMGTQTSAKAIDQFKGRSGRQGNPGYTKIVLCLEDYPLALLLNDAINKYLLESYYPEHKRFVVSEKTKELLSQLQQVYLDNDFKIRTDSHKYNEVENAQRRAVYELRQYVFFRAKDLSGFLDEYLERRKMVSIDAISREMEMEMGSLDDLRELYRVGTEDVERAKMSIISILDRLWQEHLTNIEGLRKTIFLSSYRQDDPVQEYRKDAFNLFMKQIDFLTVEAVRVLLRKEEQFEDMFGSFLNMKCFCGSGLPLMECHGKQFAKDNNLFGENELEEGEEEEDEEQSENKELEKGEGEDLK